MANVLIYSSNVIGKAMAGPSIRVWEFAKALSKKHQVTVVTPNQPDFQPDSFKLIYHNDPQLKQIAPTIDVLISQNLTIKRALLAKRYQTKIILDAYDPLPLEVLEIYKNHPSKEKKERYDSVLSNTLFSFKMADSIICASEKQRDLWMGFLLGNKLIHPTLYDEDNSLRHLIDVVPFGLSSQAPKKTGPGLRELYHLSPKDKIILWGGGIWNWFDPLTLIKAMKLIHATKPEIKLVFMGIKHPDPTVPEMAMSTSAIKLAKELGLIEKSVFFNHGWVPYEERQNLLLDADIGVSTHFDHLETRFSFRTRILDYIWAKLPIVATVGDSFAEFIQQNNLGIVVPYQEEKAIANAFISLLDNPKKMTSMKQSFEKIQASLHWDSVIKPIEQMIEGSKNTKRPLWTYHNIHACSHMFFSKIREKGLKACIQKALRKGK